MSEMQKAERCRRQKQEERHPVLDHHSMLPEVRGLAMPACDHQGCVTHCRQQSTMAAHVNRASQHASSLGDDHVISGPSNGLLAMQSRRKRSNGFQLACRESKGSYEVGTVACSSRMPHSDRICLNAKVEPQKGGSHPGQQQSSSKSACLSSPLRRRCSEAGPSQPYPCRVCQVMAMLLAR